LRSLLVAAHWFAPLFLSRAFDTPLGSVGSLLPAGVCYRALRRLPGQDFHLLEQHVFQDAPFHHRNKTWNRLGICHELAIRQGQVLHADLYSWPNRIFGINKGLLPFLLQDNHG
jgi:hypothetical protein